MYKAREIMLKESVCCLPTSKLEETKIIMKKYNCTKIPVIDNNRMIVGVVSASDLDKKNISKVIECMTKNMKAVEEDDTVDECLKIMILNNIEHVAVIDKQGRYCGLVTAGQVLK